MAKKRFVQVGVGGRARFFYENLAEKYSDSSELVAICDINKTRMDYTVKNLTENFNYPAPAMYGADEFEKMIEEQKPDCVIVTSIDRTHDKYIIKAMEMGCDVLSEKPMTMNAEKCQAILDAVKRTGKNLRVSFNYRYAPYHSLVRQLIMDDTIGEVKQVHFEWMLNTDHGADYFRRWHRDKRNSGGLLVHKSTHHFDLVNFWLGTKPKEVFAFGDLMFYGREKSTYSNERLELKVNDPIIEIHIPQGEPLSNEACRESFREAVKFFEKHFPEFEYRYFTCHSWLLDFHMEKFLKPTSNILKFRSNFDIIAYEESFSAVERLFTLNSEKQAGSSLQRNIREHLDNGGKLFAGFGIIDKNDFIK